MVGSGVPPAGFSIDDVSDILAHRSGSERHTSVFALGGMTVENMAQVRALGFDGAAVLGAVWQAADPQTAFQALQAESEALRRATPSP
jgi:thiamine-phosphate pyrophosphorylase